MNDVVALESTLGNGAAGFIALFLFGIAWLVNAKANGNKVGGISAVVLALSASFVLYASTWSQTWCDWLGGFLTGVGNMFGAEMSLPVMFMFLCGTAIGVVVLDIGVNPSDNPWAVGALIVGPVTAHGTSGGFGVFADGFFGGMALAIIEVIKAWSGA